MPAVPNRKSGLMITGSDTVSEATKITGVTSIRTGERTGKGSGGNTMRLRLKGDGAWTDLQYLKAGYDYPFAVEYVGATNTAAPAIIGF
jgi:hypothetical protein